MSDFIEIVDVSPRDGLQSQPVLLSVEHKLELINRLVGAGIRRMEAASFVNPKRVPQMEGAEEVVRGLPQRDDVTFIGLVLNLRGFERAVACNIDEINCALGASDTFNLRNQGATTEQTMGVIKEITREIQAAGINMRRHRQHRISAAPSRVKCRWKRWRAWSSAWLRWGIPIFPWRIPSAPRDRPTWLP